MLVNTELLKKVKNQLRLGMVATTPEAIPVVESLQPVIDIRRFLPGEVKILQANINLDVTVGDFVAHYTVPENKRAKLLFAHLEDGVNNTNLAIRSGASVCPCTVVGNTGFWHDFVGDKFLDAGQEFGALGTDNIGDVALDCALWYLEEDIG